MAQRLSSYVSKYVLQNPNINALLKLRLNELEQENTMLKSKRFKSTISVIKELLDGKSYYDADDCYYCLKDNIIIPLKKSKYPKLEDGDSNGSSLEGLLYLPFPF